MTRTISILLACAILTACSTTPASLAPPHPPLVAGRTVDVVPHPDIASLLVSEDEQLAANKRLVFDMWRTLKNAGQLEKTAQFLSEDYQEHSIVMAAGREGFRNYYAGTVTRVEQVPASVTDPLVTIVAEGDYVVVASVAHYLEPDDSGDSYTTTFFDMYKVEDGLISAHWDSSQLVPGQLLLPPEQGGPALVEGVEGLAQIEFLQHENPALANNKRLAFDLWRHTSEAGREEVALIYLDPIYIQHNPNAVTGREGFMEYFAQRPDTAIETYIEAPVIAMVAEGDLVVQALKGERPDPNNPGTMLDIAWIDMFRIKDGRMIEHWDTAAKGEYPRIMKEAIENQ